MSFWDRYGNLLPNDRDEFSENPTTFNVCYHFSRAWNSLLSPYGPVSSRVNAKYIDGKWRTMEHDTDKEDWSIDEKISALAFYARYNRKDWLDKIPVFPSWKNGSKWSWFRPDVMAYTLGSKYKWTRKFMKPIVLYKMGLSIDQFELRPEHESSGVQLAFIMAMGWKMDGWIKKREKLIEYALEIYYEQNGEHPTIIAWRPYEHFTD